MWTFDALWLRPVIWWRALKFSVSIFPELDRKMSKKFRKRAETEERYNRKIVLVRLVASDRGTVWNRPPGNGTGLNALRSRTGKPSGYRFAPRARSMGPTRLTVVVQRQDNWGPKRVFKCRKRVFFLETFPSTSFSRALQSSERLW